MMVPAFRRSRTLAAAALLAVLAIFGSALTPIAAAADPVTTGISGTVTSPVGPAPQTTVLAFVVGNTSQAEASTSTVDGVYELALPPGDYKVLFGPNSSEFDSEFYLDAGSWEDSTTVTVVDGAVTPNIDALLRYVPSHGTISGTVTGDNGPIAGVDVVAQGSVPWTPNGYAVTDVNGHYEITGLEIGGYRVGFFGPGITYVDEYWNNATYETYNEVGVCGGCVATADAFLATATTGVIRGTVFGEGPNNTGLEGATVEFTNVAGTFTTTTSSGPAGYYQSSELPPDDYLVKFHKGGNWADEWYADAPSAATATPVHLVAGDSVQGVIGTLPMIDPTPGSISGTIKRDGYPPTGTHGVIVIRNATAANNIQYEVESDENGNFTIPNLQPDSYYFYAYSWQGDLIEEWWNDQPTLATATAFTVEPGVDYTGIDMVLTDPGFNPTGPGSISGAVTGQGGVAVQAWVYVLTAGGDETIGYFPTAADGSYTIPNLDPRDYWLCFVTEDPEGPGAPTEWDPECWDDWHLVDGTPTSITVRPGEPVTGIDPVLSHRQIENGSVSGRVTSAAEPGGVADQAVNLLVGSSTYYFAQTDADGSYSFPDVVPGEYQVLFPGGSTYIPQYYPLTSDPLAAQSVTVGEDQDVTGIDAVLVVGGSISGTVSDTDGTPADAGVQVNINSPTGRPVSFASTDADGHFTVPTLPPGQYTVSFEQYSNSSYITEWWDDKASIQGSQLVTVTAGTETPGINATLQRGASISGTVTAAAGTSFDMLNVDAYDAAGNLVAHALTDWDGRYRFPHLNAGSYYLEFIPRGGTAAPEWWNNKPTRAGAQPITVTLGQVSSGNNVTLERGASISGTITFPPGVEQASVNAFLYDSAGRLVSQSGAGVNGPTYQFRGLVAGVYTLQFVSSNGPVTSEWWNDSPVRTGAQPIVVGTGEAITGIDATVEDGASISGTVTAPPGVDVEYVRATATSVDGEWSQFAYVSASGAYQIVGLNAGDYTLSFENFMSQTSNEWWNDSPKPGGSSSITLAAGENRTGVDAALAAGNSIQGIVLTGGARNVQLEGVTVDLLGTDGSFYESATSEVYGDYDLRGVAAGDYVLRFRKPGYVTTYSGGGTTLAGATTVHVSSSLRMPDLLLAAAAALTAAPTPTVAGTRVVGSTLTATAGTWKPAPVALTYQWKRDGLVIPGATSSTYVLTTADAGWHVTVTVTGSKDGYASQSKTSAQGAVVTGGILTSTPAPTVTGDGIVGRILTADAGSWGPGPVAFAYRWYRNGTAISGATSSTYKLVTADAGAEITVAVTGSQAGFTSVTQVSGPTLVESRLTTTPTPGITGTLAVGQVLAATTTAWGPAPVDLEYQWNSGGVAIPGAIDATYELVTADAGALVSVTVTGSKPGYTAVAKTSTARQVQGLLTVTPQPVLAGTPAVGQVLTADPGLWEPDPVTLKYKWYRDGVLIAGTAATHTIVAADAGTELTVAVTGSRTGYTPVTQTSEPVEIEGRLTATPTPVITGTLRVGQTLSVNAGTWAPLPVDLDYQWKRNGADIPGAQDPTYELVAEDAGAAITVTVTGSKSGFTSIVKTSAAKTIENLLTVTPVPTLAGIPAVGQVLTATAGTWEPAPVTLKYQWKRNGVTNVGSNSPTYTLATADAGAEISVVVTGTRSGFTPVSQSSDPVEVERVLTLGSPSITGTLDVGQTLTALPGTWGPAPVDLEYQWNRGGAPIVGATDTTYELDAVDAGASITVTVTGFKDGYTTKSRTSTAKTIKSLLTATPQPVIVGAATVGTTLSVTTGTWSPAPVTLTYRWERNGVRVGTAATYKLVAADSGAVITVTVTGAKSGYTTTSTTSAGLTIS